MTVFLPFGLFDAIGRAIGKVFGWVFENILGPILEVVFTSVVKPVFEILLDLVHALLVEAFYFLLSYILQILDVVQRAFNIFAGIAPVQYRESASTGYRSDYLINILFGQNSVSQAFWAITLIAIILAFFFSFIAIVRSMGDLEGKRPIGKVLGAAGKAVLSFFLVPFVVIVSINLSSLVLKKTEEAIQLGSGTVGATIGTHIFLAIAMDAAKEGHSFEEARTVFLNPMGNSGRYWVLSDVKQYFNLEKMNLETGIIASVIILIMMIIASFLFIQRMFELIILYLISPLFVAAMPLDDGQKFKQWRELFLGKIMSGFGIVIAMNVYLLLIPLFMGNSIVFFEDDKLSNVIMQLLFLIGGSYAVLMSHSLLLQVFNPQAAMAEGQSAGMMQGLTLGAASKVGGAAKGGAMLGMAAGKQGVSMRLAGKRAKAEQGLGDKEQRSFEAEQKTSMTKITPMARQSILGAHRAKGGTSGSTTPWTRGSYSASRSQQAAEPAPHAGGAAAAKPRTGAELLAEREKAIQPGKARQFLSGTLANYKSYREKGMPSMFGLAASAHDYRKTSKLYGDIIKETQSGGKSTRGKSDGPKVPIRAKSDTPVRMIEFRRKPPPS